MTTDGHCDYLTKSGQWANSLKISITENQEISHNVQTVAPEQIKATATGNMYIWEVAPRACNDPIKMDFFSFAARPINLWIFFQTFRNGCAGQ